MKFEIFWILSVIAAHLMFKKIRANVQELLVQINLRKLAQDELAKINKDLEQRVRDRTQDLSEKNKTLSKTLDILHDTQDQLIMHEKMASVGMLATGIAHEIKNPLNFINNFSELSSSTATDLKEFLEKEKSHIPEEYRLEIYVMAMDLYDNCKRIKTYGQRADNIVNNLLMHAQETGVKKESFKLHPFIKGVIDQAIQNYKKINPDSHVDVQTVFDPKIDELVGIPSALNQAFIYILDNAFWAIDEKKLRTQPNTYTPIVRITTKLEADAVFINFFDNGIGVPTENSKKIFEPFFTTRPTGRGNTGLGLSICYDILVKQHDGEFRVTSTENEFSEFVIKIPNNLKEFNS